MLLISLQGHTVDAVYTYSEVFQLVLESVAKLTVNACLTMMLNKYEAQHKTPNTNLCGV